MKLLSKTATSVALGIMFAGAAPAIGADAPTKLQLDAETTIGGIGVVCTGIGDSKEDPRWLAYPLRIEFANDLHEHLIGAQVTVSTMDQQQLMNVACWGSWLLLKPPGGDSYRIEGRIIGENVPPKNATVRTPASGQTRVVLQFPGVDA